MLTHIKLHVWQTLIASLFLVACGSAKPKVLVLGVKTPKIQRFDAPIIKVFVEVYNPGSSLLDLKHLEYQMVADGVFNSKGRVVIDRIIAAGSTGIVQISVPIRKTALDSSFGQVSYTLNARLFALSNKTERSWELGTSGRLQPFGPRVENKQVLSIEVAEMLK